VLRSFLISKEHTYAGNSSFSIHNALHQHVSIHAGPFPCQTSTSDPGLTPSTRGGAFTL